MRSSIWMCVDKHQHDDGCNFYASRQFLSTLDCTPITTQVLEPKLVLLVHLEAQF